jgi:transposase-like protein
MENSIKVVQRRHDYSINQRIEIVKRLREPGMTQKKLADIYNVAEKSLRNWRDTYDLTIDYGNAKVKRSFFLSK